MTTNTPTVPADASVEIADIAPAMLDYAARAGKPAEYWVVTNSYRLVYTQADGQHTLIATAWCRQPSQRERQALRRAFGVPFEAQERFAYKAGWGSMTFAWREREPEPEPQWSQATFFATSPAKR